MITSTGNSRIRELVKLKKSSKDRARKDIFLVEGPKMFREIPAELLQEVYVSESFFAGEKGALVKGTSAASEEENGALVKGTSAASEEENGALVKGTSAASEEENGALVKGTSAASEEENGALRKAVSGKPGEGKGVLRKGTPGTSEAGKCSGNGVQAEIVSDAVFQHLSDTRTPQGVLAVVKQLHYQIDDLFGTGCRMLSSDTATQPPLILILENVQDPGNLGTIVRTAEAAGVTGILMSSGCADIYNPKVTRSTMGSIFRVPFVYTPDLHGAMNDLRAQGVQMFAAHLKGSTDLYEQSYTGPCAFLIGNESKGLTAETAALADRAVRIGMSGEVESLNAAIASAVMMFEAKRQRALAGNDSGYNSGYNSGNFRFNE